MLPVQGAITIRHFPLALPIGGCYTASYFFLLPGWAERWEGARFSLPLIRWGKLVSVIMASYIEPAHTSRLALGHDE